MTEYPTRIDHTAKAFDADLQEITRKVAEMGGLAERQITDAVEALVGRDLEKGEQVIAMDPLIDAMQREIDARKSVRLSGVCDACRRGFCGDCVRHMGIACAHACPAPQFRAHREA